MNIEAVDFFYLSMPEVTTAADGSQDALLVRIAAGGYIGWGECEASPLVSIAAFVCPMSHGGCRSVGASVLGQRLDNAADIDRITRLVAYDSMDLLQAAHTFSGVEIALWDLLGKARNVPAWQLLGYSRAFKKLPYASQLFGDTPEETARLSKEAVGKGFQAVKFGWGPFGRGSVKDDADHLVAAREGLGQDGTLLIDAGQIWGEDVDAAKLRLHALEKARVAWLEEPFHGSAYEAYAALSEHCATLRLAGGEAAHNVFMARHLIDYGRIGYVQIDCGRIGGLGPAKRVADYAQKRNVTFVNHTFTSHLALSASLQPLIGIANDRICEYPVALSSLAWDLSKNHIVPDVNGEIAVPEAPGLGIDVDTVAMSRYLVPTEITVNGERLYETPRLSS
jgi:L-alanine-DL-glutamate epimerase-like enolase superfamily enzyme